MKKLVVAGLLCLAAVTGTERAAYSASFLGMNFGGKPAQSQTQTPPAVNVQSSSAEMRVQQLEEQLRQLNGRIEEMSFQILQMQESLRKTQEDNEFRFQDLEKSGGAAGSKGNTKKSEADLQPPASGQADARPQRQNDDVATIIETPQGAERAPSNDVPSDSGFGRPPQQLGSIQFDQNGNPIGGSVNENAEVGSAPLPDVNAGTSPQQTASLGSETDQYKAAYGHVLSGDYAIAEEQFTRYIAQYPGSARAADANFWLGEALYSQGKFNEAAKTFLNAHKKYGSSEKAPEMLLKLGMSLAALDNNDTACATLKEVTKRYPKASRAVISKVASEQKRLSC
ncbi:YbgF domain-containing protein [Rhizobium gallicum]|uniref:Cell division coordinator CpoB n=1 Tax=Rhizobium gallicum TaxID=56730 RepID=A0A1L5NMH3_9HYPH|nr:MULTISPECIES: tol-pal system protein YbgF [Rhizobium]APO69082.1 YbgF domain-containing protein [Rhizobium gallicum]QPB18999.1 tol-pal system protein YbgF [Rhizobium sp. 007]